MNSFQKIFFVGCFSMLWAKPASELPESISQSFIGKGTNEIATGLLQGYVEKEESMVYSPFGYSAILTIFSEGARGASREEIMSALHFPNDLATVRQAYRNVLERFAVKKNSQAPEFKNWFYIYKNYSVNEDFKNILRKYYLTEVKSVERPEEYIEVANKGRIEETITKNKNSPIDSSEVPIEETFADVPTKDVIKPKQSDGNIIKLLAGSQSSQPSLASETPSVKTLVENKGDKPLKKETSVKMKEVKGEPKSSEPLLGEKKKLHDWTPPKVEEKKQKLDGNDKMSDDESNTMKPIEVNEQIGLMSMDHFSGMTDSSLKIKGKETKSQMIVFNGLYYKGEWEIPFVKKPADDSRAFYVSENKKVFVSTIQSQGLFKTGYISNLDCKAIELPYKGSRYSLLLLVPTARDGLINLISELSGYSLNKIDEHLTEKMVDVYLPTFEINTISKPISALRKLGVSNVTSIFNAETADLSGISTDSTGLFVEELVQMVTFKVEAEYSKTNFLTASIASSRSSVQSFHVNQPFLFYLRDNFDDIVIVNGKVIDPTPRSAFYFS